MIRILITCLIALLMLNITAFTQTAKTTSAPQKIDGYIFKNSDTILLTESNVCNLDLRLLTLARNEIYARHGYTFKDKSLQDYFNNRKWYKIDAKYTGKLSNGELKNVGLIKKYEELLKKRETDGDNNKVINNISNFDLNGDGKIDKIKYKYYSSVHNEFMDTYIITINGISFKGRGESVTKYFHIIDIDENDKIKEIAIQENGFSDDLITHFYYYNGRKIIHMGDIDGFSGSYKFLNGKGTVYGRTRFKILQTWFYKDDYKLTVKHLLQHVNKPYYLIYKNEENKPVTVWKSIHLYKSPNSKKVVVKLKVGEKVNIIGSDNREWCLVKTKDGKTGWFEVSGEYGIKVKELGVDAQLVFEGLSMAD